MKIESEDEVKLQNQSKNKFFSFYEKSFIVLPNGRNIVGVNGENERTLIIEDIILNKTTTFGELEGVIYTLLYDKTTETLFAGDYSGHIKQYKKSNNTDTFTLVKDYRNVAIGAVYSSALVGGFAFFGGKNHTLIAINILERRLCKGKIKGAFDRTHSLQVCHSHSNKFYLSLGGSDPKYLSTNSDLLDVTEVYKKQEGSIKLTEKRKKFFKGSKKIKK